MPPKKPIDEAVEKSLPPKPGITEQIQSLHRRLKAIELDKGWYDSDLDEVFK